MQLVDKLLLLLLVVMLPVGIVASRQLVNKSVSAPGGSDLAALDLTLQKIANTQQSGSEVTTPEISITGVVASSVSGTLKVAGVAPKGGVGVTITATVLPSPNDGGNGVLGQAVDLRSVRTKVDGSFVFEYPIKGLAGIIEFTFEQAEAGNVVQYDLGARKQIL